MNQSFAAEVTQPDCVEIVSVLSAIQWM